MTAARPVAFASRAGFTLIELLIVVAIIAILAAIAVPNFLEAQVRGKIARARIDLASVEYALGAYAADHDGRYPPHNIDMAEFLSACATTATAASLPNYPLDAKARAAAPAVPAPDRPMRTSGRRAEKPPAGDGPQVIVNRERSFQRMDLFTQSATQDLSPLTTPIAYAAGKLPTDSFGRRSENPFAYVNLRDVAEAYPQQPVGGGEPGRRFAVFSFGPDRDGDVPYLVNPVRGPFVAYDPTNGTVSQGDIFVFGGAGTEGDAPTPPPAGRPGQRFPGGI